MSDVEEENVDIAGVTSRLSDEEIGHFSPQKVDKIKRQGYNTLFSSEFTSQRPGFAESQLCGKSISLFSKQFRFYLQFFSEKIVYFVGVYLPTARWEAGAYHPGYGC